MGKVSVKGGKALDKAKANKSKEFFVLSLYVTGATARSATAIANVKRICALYLPGRFQLQVIDIHQHPEAAQAQNLLAAPTLVKKLPLPVRKIVGALVDEGQVLAGLGIEERRVT
jgi:circadian clock protein KaiB